VRSLTHVIQQI